MKGWLLATLCCAAVAALAAADQPPQATAASDSCLTLNNRVLGPRSGDRPLPLLAGDPVHGFHPACAVRWSTLSPRNEALAVVECFRGSLLQVANDSACGRGTGPLWVNSRWVLTSAELQRPKARAATCQQLETGAWAGTRAYEFDCVPRKKELQPNSSAAAPAATAPAATAPVAAKPVDVPAEPHR
jgi:hypothetical protein